MPFRELNYSGVNDLLTLIGLSILAYEDYKYGEIHYRYLILLVGFSYPIGLMMILVVVVFYKYVSHLIGGADLLIFCLLYSSYGIKINLMVLISASLALSYCLIFKKRQVRFVPYILVSFIICIFL